MKPIKVVTLGASGQVGKALFNELKKDITFQVLGTSRKGDITAQIMKFFPFTDNWKVLGQADVLINCIGQIKETSDCDFKKIHIELTSKIISNRATLGNPKIIQVSALGAHRQHPVAFLQTKGIADDLLLNEPDTYVIRPSIICTPNTMLVRKFILMEKVIRTMNNRFIVPEGFLKTRIQPVMISDLLDAIKKICKVDLKERTIDVAGPEQINFESLIKIIESSMEKPVKVSELNERIMRLAVKFIISPLFPALINYDQYQLLFSDNISDSPIFRNILGHPPLSTLDFWKRELSNNDPLFSLSK